MTIMYWLVMPDTTDFSAFQGFGRKLSDERFLKLLVVATCAPHDVSELFLDHKDFLQQRSLNAGQKITAIGEGSLDVLTGNLPAGLNVFLALSESVPKVKSLVFSEEVSVLVVSEGSQEGILDINELESVPYCNKLDSSILDLYKKFNERAGVEKDYPPLRGEYEAEALIDSCSSSVNVANEHVLLALGFRFSNVKTLNASDPASYLNTIQEGLSYILEVINPENKIRQEVVIYSPSIYASLYNLNQNFWNQIFRNIKIKWHKEFIRTGLIRNPWYSNFVIDDADPKIISEQSPYEDELVGSILIERQRDLALTNLIISNLASAECLPALRLPNSVNLNFPKLKEIELLTRRSDKKAKRQIQKRFRELSCSLKQGWSDTFGETILAKVDSCKICSDVPLEWIYLDNLPLMISHEVSKIPMTPGNLFAQFSMLGGSVLLPESSLYKILVIRSFESHDKIKGLLEFSIRYFNLLDKLDIRFVDVKSIQEAVDALNGFDGALAIFDCHGGHDGDSQPGWLRLGRENLDTWTLADKARVPPIVLLSACSTSAIGGSHASVANGLLRSGARSVVGTFLPIDARDSSVFMARILFRIHSFLPAVKSLGFDAISWRTFLTGFFRMSFSTDVLHMFRDEFALVSEEQYISIHNDASRDINLDRPDWYENLLEGVSVASGIESESLSRMISHDHPLMETMLYCQIGRPESLIIKII